MFHPLLSHRLCLWIVVNSQWGTTFVAIDRLVFFPPGLVWTIYGRSTITGGTVEIHVLYTSCLGPRLARGVGSQTTMAGRILGIMFPRTTSRRELRSTQILLTAMGVLALGERTTPTGTCMVFKGIGGSGLSDIRPWGSNVPKVGGSSCTAVGSSPFMTDVACIFLLIIHREFEARADVFNT